MQAITRTTFRTAMCLLAVSVITSPVASVYFSPMMSCQKFCQMLTKNYVKQVWCVIDVCKKSKPRRRMAASYYKRSGGAYDSDSSALELLNQRVLPGTYEYYMAGLLNKREKEYWNAPAPTENINNENTARLLKPTVV